MIMLFYLNFPFDFILQIYNSKYTIGPRLLKIGAQLFTTELLQILVHPEPDLVAVGDL